VNQDVRVRGVRGATRVERDDAEAIVSATARLLKELLAVNDADPEDIVSIVFTATGDLRATFPAEAARRVALDDVPLLCAREIDVPGAMERVIRVLMIFHTERARDEVQSVYLEGTDVLRRSRDGAA